MMASLYWLCKDQVYNRTYLLPKITYAHIERREFILYAILISDISSSKDQVANDAKQNPV